MDSVPTLATPTLLSNSPQNGARRHCCLAEVRVPPHPLLASNQGPSLSPAEGAFDRVDPIAGGMHMAPVKQPMLLEGGRLRLDAGDQIFFPRPSGTSLFESVARSLGAGVYGMPAAAVHMEAVCESLPLPAIAPRVLELTA